MSDTSSATRAARPTAAAASSVDDDDDDAAAERRQRHDRQRREPDARLGPTEVVGVATERREERKKHHEVSSANLILGLLGTCLFRFDPVGLIPSWLLVRTRFR